MTEGARVLQIVAHPDDDLFFMNPATVHGLRAGTPSATVYLSAGDADGRNPMRLQEGLAVADKAAYTKARQNGLRAAYGAMALGNPGPPGDRPSSRRAADTRRSTPCRTGRTSPWSS
ncbi:PIG-L family deacetylase [Streptacidiphilus monticola]